MKPVSCKIVARVLSYIRALESEKPHHLSSRHLARLAGTTEAQVRKDISHFGRVGTPRRGYRKAVLKKRLEAFFIRNDVVHAVLFGAGNLGRAILGCPAFIKGRTQIVAAFDTNPKKIGRRIRGVRIYSPEMAPEVIRRRHVEIGIIAVPKEACQRSADLMVVSGLRGMINFAPAAIRVPKGVIVKDMDLTVELLSMFYELNARRILSGSRFYQK